MNAFWGCDKNLPPKQKRLSIDAMFNKRKYIEFFLLSYRKFLSMDKGYRERC